MTTATSGMLDMQVEGGQLAKERGWEFTVYYAKYVTVACVLSSHLSALWPPDGYC